VTPPGRRAVLLDRDGTLLSTDRHLGDPGLVALVPGAAEALRLLGERGWARVVVSNQSGVARRLFTEEQYRLVEAAFLAALRRAGADLEGILVCHHLPEAADTRWAKDCDCRKPRPGLLLRAAAAHGLDLGRSVMVGDALRDLDAGRNAGVGACVLVRTGKGRASESMAAGMGLADAVLDSVADLPAWLEAREGVGPPAAGR
jgi:D-glycero-D-manno-heptose 1,7-bisphosphate phosphatase